MRSLVEVCAEQRARSWAEADDQREEADARRRTRDARAQRAPPGTPLEVLTQRQRSMALRGEALALYASGKTAREVAKALGIPRNTIKTWIRVERIRREPQAREDRVDAAKLRHTLRQEGRL